MKIAVEGCAHGELDKIYETIAKLEEENNFKVDLLLCCGDFQSVRNKEDLKCMAVPEHHMKINTFYKYYTGEKKAAVLTIFIGGNHEASNYLGELPYGGWVCPNIYFMGHAGVVNFRGIRIGGLSGIYKERDYKRGRFEAPPYDGDTMRSTYHIRSLDVYRLKQINQPVHMMLSHDWPRTIYNFGDKDQLLRRKSFFRDEVEKDILGSEPARELLEHMRPLYWFSAHLHVKFAALFPHKDEDGKTECETKFLALDKCLPRRRFLQVVEIEHDTEEPEYLQYDAEWLAILRSTNHLQKMNRSNIVLPTSLNSDRWDYRVTEGEMEDLYKIFGDDDLRIKDENFERTVPAFDPERAGPRLEMRNVKMPTICLNPQTAELCARLGLTDMFAVLRGDQKHRANQLYSEQPSEASMNSSAGTASEETFASFSVTASNMSLDVTRGTSDCPQSSADVSSIQDDVKAVSKSSDAPPDNRPKRTSMNLPQASSNMAEDKKFDLSSILPADCSASSTPPNPSDNNVPANNGMTSAKKFKRRNVSVYSADDDSN